MTADKNACIYIEIPEGRAHAGDHMAAPPSLLPWPRRALRGRGTGTFSLRPRRPSLERHIPGENSRASFSRGTERRGRNGNWETPSQQDIKSASCGDHVSGARLVRGRMKDVSLEPLLLITRSALVRNLLLSDSRGANHLFPAASHSRRARPGRARRRSRTPC